MTIEAKYGGYIGRQLEQVERFRRLEDKPLPADLDYHAIPQLRAEAREKFERVRPRSLGQAGRISGISPADIATLLDPPQTTRPNPRRRLAVADITRPSHHATRRRSLSRIASEKPSSAFGQIFAFTEPSQSTDTLSVSRKSQRLSIALTARRFRLSAWPELARS